MVILTARAIESQCYVIAAAQYGRHNKKRESFGHSLAVDPWGRLLVDAGGYPVDGVEEEGENPVVKDGPSIVMCQIDLEMLESTRQRMPLNQHRKHATFSF
jgi:deaminated glutathione amidase